MPSARKCVEYLLVAVVLLALTACGQTDRAPLNEPRGQAETGTDGLTLAVHPYDNPSRLMARFEPLCRYLGRQLGRPVRLYLAHSYGDQIRQIARGRVDLAYMGPTPYLRAHDNYLKKQANNIQIIAGESQNGEPNYYSVLVVRQDGPIGHVDEMKGRTIAFGSPRSFGSYFVPRAMLLDAGVQLHDLKDYEFLGRHERVALAVAHGDFEAGGLRRDIADRYLDRGLRIIGQSSRLPPHVIVARPGLDPALVERVREALLRPGADARPAFQAFSLEGRPTTFSPIGDSAFDPARSILRRMETASPGPAPQR